jgi:hypothetical protein
MDDKAENLPITIDDDGVTQTGVKISERGIGV